MPNDAPYTEVVTPSPAIEERGGTSAAQEKADLAAYESDDGKAEGLDAAELRTYENRLPELYDREVARADDLGPQTFRITDSDAAERIDRDGSEPFKYVVTEDNDLRLQPFSGPDGDENPHSLLVDDRDSKVLAAGQVDLGVDPNTGETYGVILNNHSGHYQPPGDSLGLARDEFEARGVTVYSVEPVEY